MAKHRITLVRDDSTQHGYYSNEEWIEERRSGVVVGFSIERTEKLPDPPIVQEFRVKITSPAGMSKTSGFYLQEILTGTASLHPDRTVELEAI